MEHLFMHSHLSLSFLIGCNNSIAVNIMRFLIYVIVIHMCIYHSHKPCFCIPKLSPPQSTSLQNYSHPFPAIHAGLPSIPTGRHRNKSIARRWKTTAVHSLLYMQDYRPSYCRHRKKNNSNLPLHVNIKKNSFLPTIAPNTGTIVGLLFIYSATAPYYRRYCSTLYNVNAVVAARPLPALSLLLCPFQWRCPHEHLLFDSKLETPRQIGCLLFLCYFLFSDWICEFMFLHAYSRVII
jgi:hypothetical protein